jgi:hypothetical protein
LLLVAKHKHLDLLRCLVKDLGADVNQTARNRATPLLMRYSSAILM